MWFLKRMTDVVVHHKFDEWHENNQYFKPWIVHQNETFLHQVAVLLVETSAKLNNTSTLLTGRSLPDKT